MTTARKLTQNADFLKLWTGQTVSAFGTMFGALGLTALLYLHATPAQMGLLAAAEGIPVVLFALVAGVWVDRLQRWPIMVMANLGRVALLMTVPAAAVLGGLRIEQLIRGRVCRRPAGAGLRPLVSLLPAQPRRRGSRSGKELEAAASESVAEVGSPAVGGAIVQAVGGPAAVFVGADVHVVGRIGGSDPCAGNGGRAD